MRIDYLLAAAVLVATTAACSEDNGDNMMSSEGSALQPVDVNAALGPEPVANDGVTTGNDVVEADASSAANSTEPVAAEDAATNDRADEE